MQKKLAIPWAITSLRIGATPFILWTLTTGNSALFLILFLFSLLTDLADGLAARRLKVTSRKGGYFDAAADFILIVGVFLIFTIQGLYPYWIFAIIVASFSQFILTSKRKIQIYDPVGKYFGGLLYVIIIVTSAFPIEGLYMLSMLVIAGFFAASLASRVIYLGILNKRQITIAKFKYETRG
jgi:phosphatidylglycerophosphate synthase